MRKAPGKDVTMHTSRSGPWRVQHHGSRPFGTREEVATYKLSKSIEILWLEDGDHDLKPARPSPASPRLIIWLLWQIASAAGPKD